MASDELNSIHNRSEEQRDRSQFRVGRRVAVNVGGSEENRTEGVIASVRELPSLTTYEVRFDGYRSHEGVDTFYMADALTLLDD